MRKAAKALKLLNVHIKYLSRLFQLMFLSIKNLKTAEVYIHKSAVFFWLFIFFF